MNKRRTILKDVRLYGWHKINWQDRYVRLTATNGAGISFWIKKERQELIDKLKTRLPQG